MELQEGSKTELYQIMMARYYSSSLARFMAVDPGDDTDPQNPQSWNKYAYAQSNPLKYNDPDGEAAILAVAARAVAQATVGAVLGAVAGAGIEAGWKFFKEGKSPSQYTASDKQDIKAAAKGGAVTGALVALGGAAKLADTLVGSMALGGTSSVAGGMVERSTDSSASTQPLSGTDVARDFVAGGIGGAAAYGANQGVEVAKDVVAVASSGQADGAVLDKAGPAIVAGARGAAKWLGGQTVPEQKK